MNTIAEKQLAALWNSKLRMKRYMNKEPTAKCNTVEYP
jgi:hypothetical protein